LEIARLAEDRVKILEDVAERSARLGAQSIKREKAIREIVMIYNEGRYKQEDPSVAIKTIFTKTETLFNESLTDDEFSKNDPARSKILNFYHENPKKLESWDDISGPIFMLARLEGLEDLVLARGAEPH
jgi:hypothetical protein